MPREASPLLLLEIPQQVLKEFSVPIQIIITIKKSYVLFQFLSSSASPILPSRNQAQGQPMQAPREMSSVRHKGLEQRDWLVHGELKAVSIITHEAVQSPEMGTENPRGCLQSKGDG